MKVVIVEDEKPAAERLERMLLKADPDIIVTAKLESVSESINWLHAHERPDLIFLDIQLDDGISFEIFESVKPDVPIIFTTAYDQYAIKAFEVNSVDYLLKPIEEEALGKALNKFRTLYPVKSDSVEKLNLLIKQMVSPYKTRFFVRTGDHFQSVAIDEIQCFLIRERGTFLKTANGKTYAIDLSLDQVQNQVDPARFFRINRNFLICIDAIQDIYSYTSNRLGVKLKMLDHLEMIVSRERVADFKNWLDR